MNPKEYEKKLRELTPEELQKFKIDLGGIELMKIEEIVRNFADHRENEGRICYLLGLKTEAEKKIDAIINTANAAMQSATSAKISMICSGVACLAAIATVVVAIIKLKG